MVSLVFDDDTNSETLFTALLTNDPIPFGSWSVKGRLQGWRDARLDMVTVGTVTVFVTVVYMQLPKGLLFSDWDNLR